MIFDVFKPGRSNDTTIVRQLTGCAKHSGAEMVSVTILVAVHVGPFENPNRCLHSLKLIGSMTPYITQPLSFV